MARTGQPSRSALPPRRASFAILDVLAEAGELGTNEIARRPRRDCEHGLAPARHAGRGGLVEHVPETAATGSGSGSSSSANAVLARLDVRTVARPHLEALVAEIGETATLSVPGEPDAVTVDFVAAPHVRAGRHAARPPVDRPRHRSRQGDARVHGARVPAPPLRAYTRADDHRSGGACARSSSGCATAAGPKPTRSGSSGLNAIAAPVFGRAGESSPAILALSRARSPFRPRCCARKRSRCSSSMPPPLPTASAIGAAEVDIHHTMISGTLAAAATPLRTVEATSISTR